MYASVRRTQRAAQTAKGNGHMAAQGLTLVIGATGNVGRQVVHQLVEGGHPVRAFVRNPASAGLPAEAEIAQGDLTDPATLEAALEGVDSVFLVWPYLTLEDAPAVVDTISAGGRKVVYLSSAGIRDDRAEQDDPINRFHIGIEQMIDKSGAPWTFLRCGSFMATLLEWSEQIREGVVREAFPDAVRVLIHESDIAAIAVRALTEDGHAGRKYLLTGPEALSQVQQVRIIGEAIGRPVRFEEVTQEELREAMLSEGWADGDIDGLFAAYAQMGQVEQPVHSTVEEITGVPARSLFRWAQDHAADFR